MNTLHTNLKNVQENQENAQKYPKLQDLDVIKNNVRTPGKAHWKMVVYNEFTKKITIIHKDKEDEDRHNRLLECLEISPYNWLKIQEETAMALCSRYLGFDREAAKKLYNSEIFWEFFWDENEMNEKDYMEKVDSMPSYASLLSYEVHKKIWAGEYTPRTCLYYFLRGCAYGRNEHLQAHKNTRKPLTI